MMSSQFPIARKEGLVIQELPDEFLVYDLETNKAHCLNQTAASVWKSCDGKNSIADISELLVLGNDNPVQEDLVWLAIDQLNEINLLENKFPVNFNKQNRRQVIKKVGLAAMVALPVITSLVAPVYAGNVSCQGGLCNINMPCPGNCTCSSTTTTDGVCQ
jgi:hypothetical protein